MLILQFSWLNPMFTSVKFQYVFSVESYVGSFVNPLCSVFELHRFMIFENVVFCLTLFIYHKKLSGVV